jgi:hypothetical protein
MKNALLLCFLSFIGLTISFSQDSYVPFEPYPQDNSLIVPLNKEVNLSWDCHNPYQKTVTFTIKLIINDTQEKIFEDLKSKSVSIEVNPGDDIKWSVVSKVYEKSFTGPEWKFHVPKEFIHIFEDNITGSFADVNFSNNCFNLISNEIIEGKYRAKMLTAESNGTIVDEKNILWNDFYAHLIDGSNLIGHIFDEHGYRVGIYNLTKDTTSLIDKEYFSTVQGIKKIDSGFLVYGTSDQKTKILSLDKKLQIVDKYFAKIIAYSSDYLNDFLIVAGKKRVGNIYVPAVSIKKNNKQWVNIALEIAGVFTDCKIADDGFYVLGQIASSYKGTYDLIVSKYDLTGNLLWSNFIDNYGDDIPGELIIEDPGLKVIGTYYTNKSYSSYIVDYTPKGKTAGVCFFETEFNEFPASLISTNIGSFIFGNAEKDNNRKIYMRFTGN